MKVTAEQFEKVQSIAKDQFDFIDSENNIGFDFNGVFIVNPWMDESGRFELTTEESLAKYGTNFIHFVENVIHHYSL